MLGDAMQAKLAIIQQYVVHMYTCVHVDLSTYTLVYKWT